MVASKNIILLWFLILSVSMSSATIFQLNDTEYQRMPPLFSLDEYEPCLAEEGGTYCVLQLHLHAEPGNQLMRLITEYSDHIVKHYNYTVIDRGICVKKTCGQYISNENTRHGLVNALEACVSESLERQYGVSARVAAVLYCDRRGDTPHVDAWDWAVLAAILCIVAVNVAATLYHHAIYKQDKDKLGNDKNYLLSFSMTRNWEILTNIEPNNCKTQDLQFWHGLRVIINILTILMHTYMSFVVFTDNPHDVEKDYENPLYLTLFNGLMIVQLFFFMSGFLTVFVLLDEEKTRNFNVWDIPKIMFQRLVRLVPALAVTLALATSWVRHAASGPLWNLFVTGTLVADCRNYWWRHLLFINNYWDDDKYCLIPTWQLAAELQVFLASVSVFLLSPRRARGASLATLLVLSSLAPALHFMLQDMDVVMVAPETIRTLSSITVWFQHVPGHTNFPCFIIGMACGGLLHQWREKGDHLVKSWRYSFLQYFGVVAVCLIIYSGSMFYNDGERPLWLAQAAYMTVLRVAHGLAYSIAVIGLFTRTPTLLKKFLSWKKWVVPSRLTYCVFLLHITLLHMFVGTSSQPSHYSFANLMKVYMFVTVAAYVIAIPLSLMVEIPCYSLFKTFTRNKVPGINKRKTK